MTEDHPDWTRVYPRTFRAQWRFLIDALRHIRINPITIITI